MIEYEHVNYILKNLSNCVLLMFDMLTSYGVVFIYIRHIYYGRLGIVLPTN
jgi:hypothetical protein